ncbi:MAG: hypothetical protein UZ12_BCD005002107 [Bacteroidetes bacterium OLB12]|nr:MAG: hypothetical protein UZ12_BCD005002107 [Bacteroidetes bacterium OLB12]HNR73282.1 hypothetical protein [Cyclobacteriaceae bacterium]
MKTIFLLTLLLTFQVPGLAQFFSGEISYTVKIIPKIKNLNVDSILNQQPGTTSVYAITNGFYKSTYFKNGEVTYSYTYHGDTKRMYDEVAGKDYISFRDSRKGKTSRIRSIIYPDSTKVILGQKCFLVERVYEGYISKTYYALDLKIDPESFSSHLVGDWYNQIKEVKGSVSMTSINEYTTHFEINEVTKLTARPLKPEYFALPDKLIVASESALDKGVALAQLSKETIECYRHKMTAGLKDVPLNEFRSYIILIVSANGDLKYMEPYEKDKHELYKVAMTIISGCGINFIPGQIAGKNVDTLVYFPVDFSK